VQLEYVAGVDLDATGVETVGTCEDQPLCGVGELLGGGASIKKLGECEQCPFGTYKDANNHRWLECIKQTTCGEGEFYVDPDFVTGVDLEAAKAKGDVQLADKAASCQPCPENTYMDQKKHHNTECIEQTLCPAGEHYIAFKPSTEAAVCQPCKDTKYIDEPSHRVTKCASHFIVCGYGQHASEMNTTSKQECLECKKTGTASDGFQDQEKHSELTCKPHTQSCNPGEKITKANTTSEQECVFCEDGTYQDESGHSQDWCYTHITRCPPGQFISQENTTHDQECLACAAGTYQNGTSEEDSTHRKAFCEEHIDLSCGKGQWISELNATAERGCYDCPLGKFQDKDGHHEGKCISQPVENCDAGQWLSDLNTTAARSCFPCPADAFRPEGGHAFSKCIKRNTTCTKGQVLSEAEPTTEQVCEVCPENTYCDWEVHNKTECMPFSKYNCPSNQRFVPGTKASDQVCVACLSGETLDKEEHTDQKCLKQLVIGNVIELDTDQELVVNEATVAAAKAADEAIDKAKTFRKGLDKAIATPALNDHIADLVAKQEELASCKENCDALVEELKVLTEQVGKAQKALRDDVLSEADLKKADEAEKKRIADKLVKAKQQAKLNPEFTLNLDFETLDVQTMDLAVDMTLDTFFGPANEELSKSLQNTDYKKGSVVVTLTFADFEGHRLINQALEEFKDKLTENYKFLVDSCGSNCNKQNKVELAKLQANIASRDAAASSGGSDNTAIIVIVVVLLLLVLIVAGVYLIKGRNGDDHLPSGTRSSRSVGASSRSPRTLEQVPGSATYEECGIESGVSNPNYGQQLTGDSSVSNPNYGQQPTGDSSVSNPSYEAGAGAGTATTGNDGQYLDIAQNPPATYSVPI
jgi:hypothetical protein